jgi:hypothetical protein
MRYRPVRFNQIKVFVPGGIRVWLAAPQLRLQQCGKANLSIGQRKSVRRIRERAVSGAVARPKQDGKSAFLTGDAGVAAYSASATVTYDCVITIGSDAASAIQNQGDSVTKYANFSNWESATANSNPGFIAATGYTEVLGAVKAAVAAGWYLD